MSIDLSTMRHGTELLKRGFAKMQEGGVIMDVVTPAQAQIAEDAGATAVMALERVPSDIRRVTAKINAIVMSAPARPPSTSATPRVPRRWPTWWPTATRHVCRRHWCAGR